MVFTCKQAVKRLLLGVFLGIILSKIFQPKLGQTSKDCNLSEHHSLNRNVAEKLYHEVRIVCLIMTRPELHETRAQDVFNTWGKHCNRLVFFSTEFTASNETWDGDRDKLDNEMEIISLPALQGRKNLWKKAKEMFKYTYYNLLEDGEWFFKADDDSFAVLENMRYMLYPLSPAYPIAFGFKLLEKNVTYFSGGSGYVMSKEALVKFAEEQLLKDTPCHPEDSGNEDTIVGKCLKAAGVLLANDQDENGLRRFSTIHLKSALFIHEGAFSDPTSWFWRLVFYKPKTGFDCCSKHTVGFHYITGAQTYFTYYLIYKLKVFGLHSGSNLPMKLSLQEMDTKFRIAERKINLTDSNGVQIREKLL